VAAKFRPASSVSANLYRKFPNLLNAEWSIKSPPNDAYQCIAWAACRTDRRMWPMDDPDYWWFPGLPLATMPQAAPADYFIKGFERLGYEPCESRAFEFGYQKVAIYANEIGVTHMARQHFLGKGWFSKLGDVEDIFHRELNDIEGDASLMAGEYGTVTQMLKRRWWTALARLCLFRCLWTTFKFWLYRLTHNYEA
jgi:hypothetical protein